VTSADAPVRATSAGGEGPDDDEAVVARSPTAIALRRLRRDRAGIVAIALAAAIVIACFVGGPLLARVSGHGPNDPFPYAVDAALKPVGPWSRVPEINQAPSTDEYGEVVPPPEDAEETLFVFGADGVLGRDLLLRVLYGGQVSIEVGLLAALIALMIGVVLGGLAGMVGGLVDAGVSRLTEFVMALPVLFLLVLVGASALGDRLQEITFGFLNEGVFAVALMIGLFTWFYPARLVRAQVLSLRSREFVDASIMSGASPSQIFWRHLFPHLVPSLVTWGTLAVATGIMLEIGVTFLNAGVRLPTSSWGRILSDTWGSPLSPTRYNPATVTIWPTIFPSVAIFLTVVALHEIGEALQRVFGIERPR
jgi:peptide/nickel transport system permease protein